MGQFFIPRSRIRPKTETPFYKWANFLYSVLESLYIEIALFFSKRHFFICSTYTSTREDKGDREGILHTHPIP